MCSVNGEPLFLKGAYHGPTRALPAEATPAEVRADVERAAEAGLDLLRVHAHVARPELYDTADETGLLLWQDLPLHGPYARGIRRQAVRQAQAMVDLLGHHPAVALWCGHDEPVPLDRRASPLRAVAAQQLPSWNRTVLDASVKRALTRADRSRPVVAHSGVAPHLPQIEGTDTHLGLGWGTGDERDLPALARTLPRLVRFVSGLGAASIPDGDCGPGPLSDLDREVLDERFPPADFPDAAARRDATQAYQARVVRRQVEELRRLKYRPTGGFAVSRLADAQPAVTSAVLDADRRPKAAWDALRAACRPVVVVADRLPADGGARRHAGARRPRGVRPAPAPGRCRGHGRAVVAGRRPRLALGRRRRARRLRAGGNTPGRRARRRGRPGARPGAAVAGRRTRYEPRPGTRRFPYALDF